MAWDQDNLLFALAHAGLRCGPGRPVDTERFVGALAEHGFSLVPPEYRGRYWLEVTVEDIVRAGWGWPSPDVPAAATFSASAALAEMLLGERGVRHVDDPTDEDLLLQRISDEALVREVLRRGLDPYAPEPTQGPTP